MIPRRNKTVLLTSKKRAKYGNQRTKVGDTWFDSKAEGQRWIELKALQRKGEIRNLQRQVPFPLEVSCVEIGRPPVLIGKYIADFVYCRCADDETIVEDVKGYRTALYKWKKRHVEAQYGLEIWEV